MQDGYEDALLGDIDIDYISDFTYDISDVISNGNLEICPKAHYKHRLEQNYASTPGHKNNRKEIQDVETPRKYAKYPEKAFKWTKAEKNEFIARPNLWKGNQYEPPEKHLEHPHSKIFPIDSELKPVELIKGLYGPKDTEHRRYGPSIKGLYGPK